MTYDTINDAQTIAGGGNSMLLAGRYRVVRQLGQGGMGSVWLAEDTQLDGKKFAIKMLPSILVSNKRAYNQLKAEALVSMKLTHPNIVTLRAFEENSGNPFLVMDYIEGQTLDDYLAEKGKLSEEEVIRVLRPIAAALDYAHSEGVVHRDVKPANVMIRKDGHPFILDFGIAREIQETLTRVTGKLSSGTLLYMSPEQLSGAQPKASQDVYSFSAMAYECLKGEPPFARGQIEWQIINVQPESLQGIEIAAAVMAGLVKNPENRPKNCADVIVGNREIHDQCGVSHVVCNQTEEQDHALRKDATATGREEALKGENRAIESMRLKTLINIKVSDAKSKMECIEAFRSNVEGLEARIRSADEQWRMLTALASPNDHEEAKAAFEIATEAEAQISSDLDWLSANKSKRDTVKSIEIQLDSLRSGDVTKYNAEQYASEMVQEASRLRNRGCEAFARGAFDEAKELFVKAIDVFVSAVDVAKKAAEKEAIIERMRIMLNAAREYEAIGKWEECIAVANRVLELDANNNEALSLKTESEGKIRLDNMLIVARDYGNSAKWSECIYAANKVLELDANNDEALRLKTAAEKKIRIDSLLAEAREYANNAQWDKCICSVTEILVLDVNNHEAEELKETAQSNCDLKYGAERSLMLPSGLLIEMIYCLPGTFMMGSLESEKGCRSNETQHLVKLTKGFWLGKYPVTQEQWQSVVGDNPSHFRGNRNPVENISWNDCQDFIKKVNDRLNCGARLPTEAEWEYACRAGTTGAYGGTGSLEDMGWFDNATSKIGLSTHPVGEKMANDWGFHDMHGNVWEWCDDWYGDYEANAIDPHGPVRGSRCVLRGGCWSAHARNCRSASRGRFIPELRTNSCGFRLCCDKIP